MENENIEESLLETTETPLESEENNPVPETDTVLVQETLENVPETSDDVSDSENVTDSPILEETETETEIVEETETETAEENGEVTNEEIVFMQDGSEDFYSTLSGNDVMGDGSASSGDTYYVTYEVVQEESPLLWDSNILELSSTDMLLFMIFLLLLVRFIHDFFKGSHWFKG